MRNHHGFMLLSGVSLCVIGGSIVDFRLEPAAEIVAVNARRPAYSLSVATSHHAFPDVLNGVHRQVGVGAMQREDAFAGSSHVETPGAKRNATPVAYSVAAAKQEEYTSSFAPIQNKEQSEKFVPVSSENDSWVSAALETSSAEPLAVQNASFYGYSPVIIPRPNVVKVDPSAPGNALTSNGKRLMVDAYTVPVQDSELELDVVIDADASPNFPEPSGEQTAATRETGAETVAAGGFTYEEELFRTKWGWAAFNKVQQAAKENPWGSGQ